MRKRWLLATFMLLLAAGCTAPPSSSTQPGVWAELPNRVGDGEMAVAHQAIQGAKGQDLRRKDFSQVSSEHMYDLTYDTETRWPAAKKLPAGFDPDRVLKWGLDPGLGLRMLHQQGIDGRGITVAVFDKPIRPTHQEFAGHMEYIEVFPDDPGSKTPHFHGAATASILAGRSLGVAPGAKLYYFAVPDNGQNIANYAVALEKLLAMNAALPAEQRVRVISVSDGYNQAMMGRDDVIRYHALIKKAEGQGIAFVHCSTVFPIHYDLTGALPETDRNNPDNYAGSGYVLMVPGYARTTAGNESDKAYTYWAKGGASWVAPYLAGLAALGLQVNPKATPEQLYAAIVDTATINSKGVRIVNPAGIIERLR